MSAAGDVIGYLREKAREGPIVRPAPTSARRKVDVALLLSVGEADLLLAHLEAKSSEYLADRDILNVRYGGILSTLHRQLAVARSHGAGADAIVAFFVSGEVYGSLVCCVERALPSIAAKLVRMREIALRRQLEWRAS